MNLLQVRQLFRTTSGRYDLVNDDGSDNGANVYLNEGRKFLDRSNETKKTWGSHFSFIEIGGFSTSFPQCRAIKEVWVATLTARWQLEKMKYQDLIATYMTQLPSGIESGSPLYYSPIISRYIPENLTAQQLSAFTGYVDVQAGDFHEYNSIIVMPPTSEKLLVEVKGFFYSLELVNDTDENYWSIISPMALIMSAMRYIEILNRNTEGVKDWERSIATELTQLEFDLIEELIAEVDEMEPDTETFID
jgi:hypothetical protein